MLKKLRLKFVALTMSIIAVVLVVVFAAICVINYQQSLGQVFEALEGSLVSIGHGGGPGAQPPRSAWEEPAEDAAGADAAGAGESAGAVGAEGDGAANAGAGASAEASGAGDTNTSEADGVGGTFGKLPETSSASGVLPPEIGGKRGGSDAFIPVALYVVDSEGALTALPSRATASLSEAVLEEAARLLSEAPDGEGSLDGLGLFYAKRQVSGSTYLAFADMSAANGWQSLALTLAGVGAAALAVLFVISVFFARWALRPVEQAWEKQRRFVADASHELKTPLTVILANTSILLEHPERSIASQSQWVESTQTEAEDMQHLVGDLLFLAKLDEDEAHESALGKQDEYPFERLDFSDMVEGDLLQFESVAFERGLQVSSHIAPNVQVAGDSQKLHRLVTTLIDNACKYTNEGGSVHVALQQTSHHLELSVRNTGPAIAPDDLPYIFDRFYRADKARTRDSGGYGLGLAIARAVAQEHGGTLAVTSSDEEGTTFTTTLPLKTSA